MIVDLVHCTVVRQICRSGELTPFFNIVILEQIWVEHFVYLEFELER